MGSKRYPNQTGARPRRTWLWLLPLASFALLASCHRGGVAAPTSEPAGEAQAALGSPFLAEVCPGTTLVGRVFPAGASCPEPLDNDLWQVSELAAVPTGSPLDDFCVYDWLPAWEPPSGAIDSAGELNGQAPSTWLHPDCFAVSASTPPAKAAAALVNDDLATAFFAQVEPVTSLSVEPSGPVRIAIVDSWPKNESLANPGQLRHGLAMATIARETACSGTPSCLVDVSSHLALNLEPPHTPNNLEGGYFGGQVRLARVLGIAVTSWLAEAPSAHLIINISLGWDGEYNLGAEEPVRQALRYAACKGALIFAAAGNTSGGPVESSGPTFPAAWETELAPTNLPGMTCQTGQNQPLVFAVGGVDGRDRTLSNARPLARPRLAAPAFAAVAKDFGLPGSPPLGPFTGTSVSAAVASGVAAASWSHDPAQTAFDVVNQIWAAGVPLGPPADFCAGGSCQHVRRLSVCRSLLGLGITAGCTLIPRATGTNGAWTSAQLTAVSGLAGTVVTIPDLSNEVTVAGCTGSLFIPGGEVAASVAFPCVSEQLPNASMAPHIEAQPVKNPCGACTFVEEPGGTSILYAGVHTSLSGSAYPQTLSLQLGRETVARYDLGSVGAIAPGELFEIKIPDVTLQYNSREYDAAVIEWLQTETDPEIQSTSEVPIKVGL